MAQMGWKTRMEDSGAFALTTSSMTMEHLAVTRAIIWLETHIQSCMFPHWFDDNAQKDQDWVDSMEMVGGYWEIKSKSCMFHFCVRACGCEKQWACRQTGSCAGWYSNRLYNWRISDAAHNSESTIMNRLLELYVKASSAGSNNTLKDREELWTSITLGPLVVTHWLIYLGRFSRYTIWHCHILSISTLRHEAFRDREKKKT
jgi:hypothetical protein